MISRVQLLTPPGYDFSVGPRRDIDRLRSELEELFDEAWRSPRFSSRRCFRPAVDCFHTSDPPEFVVLVELPGVDPEQIAVTAAEGSLWIAGIRKRPRADEGQVYYRMELDYGRFERRIPLPENVDVGGANGTYERGLLKVVFPVAAAWEPGPKIAIAIHRER
jgi:HSP20 family protein